MTCLFFLEMIIVKNLFNTKKKGISITGSNTAGELAVAIERALRRCTNLNESREGRRERILFQKKNLKKKKKFREQVFFSSIPPIHPNIFVSSSEFQVLQELFPSRPSSGATFKTVPVFFVSRCSWSWCWS